MASNEITMPKNDSNRRNTVQQESRQGQVPALDLKKSMESGVAGQFGRRRTESDTNIKRSTDSTADIGSSLKQRRPVVTIKQKDIIFLPDKGCPEAIVAFDVSRKQAELLPIIPQTALNGGNQSARGSSHRGNSSSSQREMRIPRGANISGAAGSNSYRAAKTGAPILINHHYSDLSELIIMSKKEASITNRMHIRDSLQARQPLGCQAFQNEIKKGVHAICTSPDSHSVAILTREFAVLIHDKIKERTFKVQRVDIEFFQSARQISIDSLIDQTNASSRIRSNSMIPSLDKYSLYVSNNSTSIFVISDSEKLVATWTQSFGQKRHQAKQVASNKQTKKRNYQQISPFLRSSSRIERDSAIDAVIDPPARRLSNLFSRSNSTSKIKQNGKDSSRSTSRLRDFFRSSSQKKETSQNNKNQNNKDQQSPQKGMLSRSQSLSGGPANPVNHLLQQNKQHKLSISEPEILIGHWTNISLHSLTKLDLNLNTMASTNTVSFTNRRNSKIQESSYTCGLPTRLGSRKNIQSLNYHFVQQGSLISVKMIACTNSEDTINENFNQIDLDKDSRKILLFSQQTVEQDKVFKGNAWYQNPFYLIDKVTFATEIEFMGVLPQAKNASNNSDQLNNNNSNNDRVLVARCDNQGTLLAVVVNSIHKIYCQLLFVSIKKQFASVMKLFNFVSAEDNPPFDCKGKTNLQVDDLAWTKNDAFVILMFNTGAIAVLPRLGCNLLQIYNPTIINVHYNDAANFTSYKVPRCFNELIPKTEISNKVRKQSKNNNTNNKGVWNNESNGYRIAMHPSEDAFVIYSGSVAYLMQLELDIDLQDLFKSEENNQLHNFYFTRFSKSMQSLSKNQELNRNLMKTFDIQIQAAAVETSSSDSPQLFKELLYYFKHMLFAFRWDASQNFDGGAGGGKSLFLQQLIKLTDSLFWRYLGKGEPVLAYHVLMISENYINNVFQQKSKLDQNKQVQPNYRTDEQFLKVLQKSIFESNSNGESELKNSFKRTTQRLASKFYQRKMDSNLELFDNNQGQGGLGSLTLLAEMVTEQDGDGAVSPELESDLRLLLPLEKSFQDKQSERSGNIFNQLPIMVVSQESDGNMSFQFQRNYLLLALFCLIQFRNYQAKCPNVLYLIFASQIFKRHANAKFIEALQKLSAIILYNSTKCVKDDSDDDSQPNNICNNKGLQDFPKMVDLAQNWMKYFVPYHSIFNRTILNRKTLRHHLQIRKNYSQQIVGTQQDVEITQAQEDHQPLLLSLFNSLENLDYSKAISQLKQMTLNFNKTKVDQKIINTISPVQAIGMGITVFANSLFHTLLSEDGSRVKTFSTEMALNCIARQSIKIDKTKQPPDSCGREIPSLNTVSQHTKIYDGAFVYHRSCTRETRNKILKSQLLLDLQINSNTELKKFTAMLFAYTGDFQRAALILKPSIARPASMDLLIFNVLLQASALKTHSKNFLYLSDLLQGKSLQESKNIQELQQNTERLNCLQVVKYTMAEVNCTMQRIMSTSSNSFYYKEYLWASFSMLPIGVALLFKEQIARDSLSNLKSILAFQMRNERTGVQESFPQKLVLKEFQLAKKFFDKLLEENCELLEYILPHQISLRRRFFQQVEIILICFYDQHKDQVIFETTEHLLDISVAKKQASANKEPTMEVTNDRVLSLITKDFRKFAKIFSYLKLRTDIKALDNQILMYRQTDVSNAIESQVMICCNYFQLFPHFPKYTNVQLFLKRALCIFIQILFHTQAQDLRIDLRKLSLTIIGKIQYGKLSRQNKLVLNSILSKCKNLMQSSSEQSEKFSLIARSLEMLISGKNSSSQQPMPMINKNKLVATSQQSNHQENEEMFNQMLEEVMTWLRFEILPSLDFKKLNIRGHRRCIQAKKDLFAQAAAMHGKLSLPMTEFSLFFRGMNFQVKHMNTFGVGDADLINFLKLLAEDQQDNDTCIVEKTRFVSGQKARMEKGNPVQVLQDQSEDEELNDEEEQVTNKTRVERMADQSILGELKMESSHQNLPSEMIDLEKLVMDHTQLYDKAEQLQENQEQSAEEDYQDQQKIDLLNSDNSEERIGSGLQKFDGFLLHENKNTIQPDLVTKVEAIDDNIVEEGHQVIMAYKMGRIQKHIKNIKNNQNSASLSSNQQDQSQNQAIVDSRQKIMPTKITIRRSSARRRMPEESKQPNQNILPKNNNANQSDKKLARAPLPPSMKKALGLPSGLPPKSTLKQAITVEKANSASQNATTSLGNSIQAENTDENHQSPSKEAKKTKKQFKPLLNLIYLKKKVKQPKDQETLIEPQTSTDTQPVVEEEKSEVPMKNLAQSEEQNAEQEEESAAQQQQQQKLKLVVKKKKKKKLNSDKPFQVQLVKVNKKAAVSENANLSTGGVQSITTTNKDELMEQMMAKLNSIQSQADTINQDLSSQKQNM